MLTAKLDDTLLSKPLDITYNTVRVRIFTHSQVFILSYTVLMKTRWMKQLISVAIARMATFKKLSTTLP